MVNSFSAFFLIFYVSEGCRLLIKINKDVKKVLF